MSFQLFKEQKSEELSFFDSNKNKEIRDKLCEKRRILEELTPGIPEEKLAEHLKSIEELTNAMRTFGISPIDYQIYLEGHKVKSA